MVWTVFWTVRHHHSTWFTPSSNHEPKLIKVAKLQPQSFPWLGFHPRFCITMLQHCCLYLLPAAEVLQHICKKKHVQDNIEFYMFWWILSTESCQYLGSISGWCVNTVKQNTQLNCCRDGNNLISKATNLPSISNPGIQLVFADLIFCSLGPFGRVYYC